MSITTCQVCGFIYDEWAGDTKNGVPKGTSLYELAGSLCNRCGLQGERHLKEPTAVYENMEADYYDQFAGKSGVSFYCDFLANGDPQQQVLEIGVGTGRIAVELCRKGIPVTGIDHSGDMLKVANKKAKAFLKHQPDLLELIQMDVQQLELNQPFSHIILPDGVLQHFTVMSEQVAILQKIHTHLRQDGMIAIDIILPPVSKEWTFRHRKKLMNQQEIHVDIQGETSLTRQIYRYEATFEKFVQGQSKERYRVDRELSLMLPKEAALLLESQGFKVVKMVNNYQSHHIQGWQSSYPLLKTNESLQEEVHEFKESVWSNGGYPFSGLIEEKHAAPVEYWTIIAKK
ncbi:methyltransferase domain-containing protein [Bacillus sp. Hm123]|uniref:methyltransferase domain-containing protein n=1 Tax=Bacillus sp. Hm123 TaxID=3450745 RepID=UPI003F42165C